MPEGATRGIGEFLGSTTGRILFGIQAGSLLGATGEPPSAPGVPTAEDVRQRDLADATRRRALIRGGRAATILTDDTETPLGQQIPASRIGRTTLLGG